MKRGGPYRRRFADGRGIQRRQTPERIGIKRRWAPRRSAGRRDGSFSNEVKRLYTNYL